MPTRRFGFSFEVSRRFLAESPVALEYVALCKAQIAARRSITGPRGGLYRLVTPPDHWREGQDDFGFVRNMTTFATKREGRYVRPGRASPDLRLGDEIVLDSLTTRVLDGRATLPDGRIVEVSSPFLAFPVLARHRCLTL